MSYKLLECIRMIVMVLKLPISQLGDMIVLVLNAMIYSIFLIVNIHLRKCNSISLL